MAEVASFTHSLPAWMDVLDRIEQGLRQSLEHAVEPAEPAALVEAFDSATLRSLDDRLAIWQTRLDRAALQTEDAGTLATREETALAELIQGMREVGKRW